jgi:uncharacterized protein YraI
VLHSLVVPTAHRRTALSDLPVLDLQRISAVAQHRHKRDTDARFKPRAALIAGPLAVLATASAVSLGVAGADLPTPAPAQSAAPATAERPSLTSTTAGIQARRLPTLNRSGARRTEAKPKPKPPSKIELKIDRLMAPAAVRTALAGADTKRWTTEALNLWSEPGDAAEQTGVVDAGEPVVLTGRTLLGREEIRWGKGEVRWVTAGYLSEEEPSTLGGDCTNGTSVPSGVSPNIVKVHQAVCANFPSITTYGTFRGDGEHAQGIAVDIMVSGERGWQVAEFLRANYSELGISYLIYSQQIWSVERGGEGWRGMSDRGSTTANHYDHVHVTTY